jgi:hypothetical protein
MFLSKHPKMEILDGGGDGGGTPTPTPTPAPAYDWGKIKETLPEDIRADSSLSTINSLEGLVKSYVHSQKAMGNRVPIPDKHATPEDWQQFFRKVGNPEKLEEYKVNVPKDTQFKEEFIKSVTEEAHKAGVLPWQLERILGKYAEIANGEMQQLTQSEEMQLKKDIEDLKKEWGPAFDDKKRAANVAFKELLPDEADRQRLIDDGLTSHPALVKILANAAKLFKEDVFIGHGDGKLGGITPEDALKKANEIMGDMNHPYRNPAHPNHKAAQKEVADLFSIAYPS